MKECVYDTGNIGIQLNGRMIVKIDNDCLASHAGVDKDWILLSINGEKQPDDDKKINNAIEETLRLCEQVAIIFQEIRPDVGYFKLIGEDWCKTVYQTSVYLGRK